MKNPDETVALLNSLIKVKIALSKIHGVGVFAMTHIPKGSKLYAEITPQVFQIKVEDLDKLIPDVKNLLLERWPQIINGSAFAYPTERIQAFMNHSDKPNYDAMNDVMLEDVWKGDEITEDYRKIPNYEKVFTWLVDKKS